MYAHIRTLTWQASQEHAARVGNDDMGGLYGYGFVSIILAIVSWITDNLVCATLQNLTLGMPYVCLSSIVFWSGGGGGGLFSWDTKLFCQQLGIPSYFASKLANVRGGPTSRVHNSHGAWGCSSQVVTGWCAVLLPGTRSCMPLAGMLGRLAYVHPATKYFVTRG